MVGITDESVPENKSRIHSSSKWQFCKNFVAILPSHVILKVKLVLFLFYDVKLDKKLVDFDL